MFCILSLKKLIIELKIINTRKEYQASFNWRDEIFDKKVKPSSATGEKLQLALLLMKQYED